MFLSTPFANKWALTPARAAGGASSGAFSARAPARSRAALSTPTTPMPARTAARTLRADADPHASARDGDAERSRGLTRRDALRNTAAVAAFAAAAAAAAAGVAADVRPRDAHAEESATFSKGSGVKVQDIVLGQKSPVPVIDGATCTVRYQVWLNAFEGRKIDGGRLTFKQGNKEVIGGLDDGILGMKAGGDRRLVIPPKLAYGDKGAGKIPANATLFMDVQLDSFKNPKPIVSDKQ